MFDINYAEFHYLLTLNEVPFTVFSVDFRNKLSLYKRPNRCIK